jgi:hypothetical protein
MARRKSHAKILGPANDFPYQVIEILCGSLPDGAWAAFLDDCKYNDPDEVFPYEEYLGRQPRRKRSSLTPFKYRFMLYMQGMGVSVAHLARLCNISETQIRNVDREYTQWWVGFKTSIPYLRENAEDILTEALIMITEKCGKTR